MFSIQLPVVLHERLCLVMLKLVRVPRGFFLVPAFPLNGAEGV